MAVMVDIDAKVKYNGYCSGSKFIQSLRFKAT